MKHPAYSYAALMLGVAAQDIQFADYGVLSAVGYPKPGQTLEEARDLLLEEIQKLRAGDFDEKLLASTIANYKLREMRALENNRSRAMAYVYSFINGVVLPIDGAFSAFSGV